MQEANCDYLLVGCNACVSHGIVNPHDRNVATGSGVPGSALLDNTCFCDLFVSAQTFGCLLCATDGVCQSSKALVIDIHVLTL